MRTWCLLVTVLIIAGPCSLLAQDKLSLPDSTILRKVDSLQLPGSKLDSLSLSELNSIDSSINHFTKKIDSLQSLRLPVARYKTKIDSLSQRLEFGFSIQDKTNRMKGAASGPLTIVNLKRDSLQNEIRKKSAALQHKIMGSAHAVDSLLRKAENSIKSKLEKITATENKILKESQLPNSSLALPTTNALPKELNPSGELNQLKTLGRAIPNTNLPNAELPLNPSLGTSEMKQPSSINAEVPAISQENVITSELKKLETATSKGISGTEVMKSISELKAEEEKVKGIKKKTDAYKQDIKKAGKGEIQQMQALPKEAENAAANLSEMKELKTQQAQIQTTKNALQEYNDLLKNMGTPKGLKDAATLARKEMPDLFAGHEAKLQAGIAELDKLRKKYHTITDSRYLPKHAPNEMKGKPLKERLVPGLTLQVYKGDKLGIDVSPYLMYRVTGKLRLGASATYRVLVNTKQWNIRPGMVYGVRAMADYRWINSFYGHVEGEWLHYDPTVQNQYRFPADPPLKDWNARLNMGILRTYKISRRFTGQYQMLYNALDWTRFPQNKNASVRFGFEYQLNAKRPGKR